MIEMQEEFVDYSTILMKIEVLEREAHEACLQNQFELVPGLANRIIDQATQLKLWVKAQQ